MARPEYWNKERKTLAISIVLESIECGDSLRAILNDKRDKEILPSRKTFNEWLCNDDVLSDQYARACSDRADGIFDQILTIADATEDDIIMDENGKLITNHNVIQRDRLRVDTRKWALSKMNPKKYGDKVDVTSGGEKINNSNPYLTTEQKKLLDDKLNSEY